MTQREYMQAFTSDLDRRTEIITMREARTGADIKNKEVLQKIKEEAYNFYLSDEIHETMDIEKWLTVTAGRMLLEEGNPEAVIKMINNDNEGLPDSEIPMTDRLLIDIMKKLAA